MPKTQHSRVHMETCKMGNRSYELAVHREGGGFYGSWTCDNGQTGFASVPESSIADATRGALLNAQRYHSLNPETSA